MSAQSANTTSSVDPKFPTSTPSSQPANAPAQASVSIHGKEAEGTPVIKGEISASESQEFEIPKEVASVGVREIKGTIELPPDVKRLGVAPSGSQTPVVSLPTVSLPLTDDKILQGVNAPLTSAFKWLAVWCIKKLQKAHLVLKNIHGKIIRVKN